MKFQAIVVWVDERGEFILDGQGIPKDFTLLRGVGNRIVKKGMIPFRFRINISSDVSDFESTVRTFREKHICYIFDVTHYAELRQIATRLF